MVERRREMSKKKMSLLKKSLQLLSDEDSEVVEIQTGGTSFQSHNHEIYQIIVKMKK